MNSSETIAKIAPALVKAQKEMEGAKKDAKNPFFKSKYADYGAVLEACKGALNNNGISILQPHKVIQSENSEMSVVETILLHESGEFISSQTKVEIAKKGDPQALGSAITYARRYGLQSIVALPAEDDDGESAMNREQTSFAKKGSKKVTKKAPAKAEKPAKVETQPDKSADTESTAGGTEAPKASGRSFRRG